MNNHSFAAQQDFVCPQNTVSHHSAYTQHSTYKLYMPFGYISMSIELWRNPTAYRERLINSLKYNQLIDSNHNAVWTLFTSKGHTVLC